MSPYRESETESIPAAAVRYFRVDRRDLVYLKFILEAYEGMSTLSTVDPQGGVVRLSVPDGFAADMQDIIEAVGTEIPLQEVTFAAEEAVHA